MEKIAVIGIACRFPRAKNLQDLWQLLSDGIDVIVETPPERWDIKNLHSLNDKTSKEINIRWGGFLEGVDRFDPQFFGISPREANSIDPQQRLLLEVGWEALEHAGINPDKLSGSRTGVFIGVSNYDYSRLLCQDYKYLDAYAGIGTAKSLTANRLSYFLNLLGPSIAVDTACSSSLVAVHLACQSLHNKESDLAIVGGVNLILSPEATISFAQANMMAFNGRCKTFDADADGYVRSEGCAVIILKRFADAFRDKDSILGIVRGSAVNQDGRSNGITAPNGLAQQAVIRDALASAKLSPSQISYIETHGTGTIIGDPIEVDALKEVLLENRRLDQSCGLGSIKTNIGHTESAAGIASLIKVILAMQHEEIPPNLHLKKLNPYISLENTPFYIPTKRCVWSRNIEKRFAGVSSFGIGGTNAHVVLEEPPSFYSTSDDTIELNLYDNLSSLPLNIDPSHHLFTISAKNRKALEELAQSYIYFLADCSSSLADICFTTNIGRAHFSDRLAFTTSSKADLHEQLLAFTSGRAIDNEVQSYLARSRNKNKIAFLFAGQGSQYLNMGRQLYETQPVFRKIIDQCNELLYPYLGQTLLSVLYPASDCSPLLKETAYMQPIIFTLEYALVELWCSWGIIPDVVMGHSLGEYVAACVARVFSWEDGLKLVAERGRLMQLLSQNGEMAVVFADQKLVSAAIKPYIKQVSIAAINGPENVVISGERNTVISVITKLKTQGIKVQKLAVSHAFHSPLMEPILNDFARIANKIKYYSPQIKIISNVSGKLVKSQEISQPGYWCRHLREAVKFSAGMETLRDQGYEVFIEIGPSSTLLNMGKRCLSHNKNPVIFLPCLNRKKDDWQQLLESLASLYVRGVKVDWSGFHHEYKRRRVVLPTYPFQRERYWFEAITPKSLKTVNDIQKNYRSINFYPVGHPLLGKCLDNVALNKEQIVFESIFSQYSSEFLQDYRVNGNTILPVAVYVEIALAAGQNLLKTDRLQIDNLLIQEELIFEDEKFKRVQVILQQNQGQEYLFKIFSKTYQQDRNDEPWLLHAYGTLKHLMESGQNVEHLTLLKQQCKQSLSITGLYRAFDKFGLQYGESFQAISELWCNDDRNQGLGLINLQLNQINSDIDYLLHPVLLNACFQILGTAFQNNENTYLPVGFDVLKLFKTPDKQVWCHTIIREAKQINKKSLSADLRCYSTQGNLCFEVIGLQLLHVKHKQNILIKNVKQDFDDFLYHLVWQKQDIKPSINSDSRLWFIFADEERIGERIAESLIEIGDNCILIYNTQFSHAPQKDDRNRYFINSSNQQHYDLLFEESLERLIQGQHSPKLGLLYLWGLNENQESLFEHSLIDSGLLGCGALMNIVQAIKRNPRTQAIPLFICTRGVQVVDSNTNFVQFQQSSLWGMARVIEVEHPELSCRLIDLESNNCKDYSEIECLLEELKSTHSNSQIAYCKGKRYVAKMERSKINKQSEIVKEKRVIRSDKSYLITGGVGALGLKVAELLITEGARHLVLTRRSQLTAQTKKNISELESIGVELSVVKADIAKESDVKSLLDTINKSMPPLGGVVHAAGVLDDGVLLNQDWHRFEKVMAPKVLGALFLHKFTAQSNLDFFICFSSIASLMGSPGQSNYAAANSFLNALMEHRFLKGLAGLSINWGPWGEVGMAAQLSEVEKHRMQALGLERLSVEQGLSILKELLNAEVPQIAVANISWHRFAKTISLESKKLFYQNFTNSDKIVQNCRKQDGDFLASFHNISSSQRKNFLLNYLINQIADVLGFSSTQEIQPHHKLFDLGIDSLLSFEMKTRLEKDLETNLPSTLMFDYPTVELMAEYLQNHIIDSSVIGKTEYNELELQSKKAAPNLSFFKEEISSSQMEEMYLNVNGIKLCVCSWGPKDGILVVCLHGILEQGAIWDNLAKELVSQGYRVIAPDLRGHGRSDHSSLANSTNLIDYLKDVDEFLKLFNQDKFILVGHSFGSIIASIYVSIRPENISHLVLVETFLPHKDDERNIVTQLTEQLECKHISQEHPVFQNVSTAAKLLRQNMPFLSVEQSEMLANRTTKYCENGVTWSWDSSLRNSYSIFSNYGTRSQYLMVLENIKSPITLVFGDKSEFNTAEDLAAYQRVMPNSKLVKLSGGHNVHLESTRHLSEIIRSFNFLT